MLKKVYERVKKFINDNIREAIVLLSFYVVMTYPLPYYILVSGGTIDVSDRVTIAEEYETEGSFSLAYVNELKGTLPTVLLSKVMSNWTLYSESSYTIDDTEDSTDINKRSQLELQQSLQSSVMVAYSEAGYDVNITNTSYYAYYVYDYVKSSSDIAVGDKIVSYDGITLTDINDYKDYIDTIEAGDTIEVVLERDGKEVSTKLRVYEEDGTKITGIMVLTLYDYETNPSIEFNFSSNESGPSGGLTLTLAIYNKLVKEDITGGLNIVGTGTIESDGSVGEIGGVEYKLKGAVKEGADIFIVPNGDNYENAVSLKEKEGYDIEIIGVDSFSDALEKLDNYVNN